MRAADEFMVMAWFWRYWRIQPRQKAIVAIHDRFLTQNKRHSGLRLPKLGRFCRIPAIFLRLRPHQANHDGPKPLEFAGFLGSTVLL